MTGDSSTFDIARINAFLDDVQATDQADLRKVFNSYKAEYNTDVPEDPFGDEYRAHVLDQYHQLAGRQYEVTNEVTNLEREDFSKSPYPYFTRSAGIVGAHLIGVGTVCRSLADLPQGARVLDCGVGWGNTSLALARSGYKVTAIDADPGFIELVQQRAELEFTEIETRLGDFRVVMEELAAEGRTFDAVVFFESFHHTTEHAQLLETIPSVLEPDGCLVFAAEPITPEFPVPWGLRMDGESLWAIRCNGWMELGFNTEYFTQLLRRNGWVEQRIEAPKHLRYLDALVCRRQKDRTLRWDFQTLNSEVGQRLLHGIASDGRSGNLLFGPYARLMEGHWKFEIEVTDTPTPSGTVVVDIAAEKGEHILAERTYDLDNHRGNLVIEADLPDEVDEVEVRVRVNPETQLCGVGFTATRLGDSTTPPSPRPAPTPAVEEPPAETPSVDASTDQPPAVAEPSVGLARRLYARVPGPVRRRLSPALKRLF